MLGVKEDHNAHIVDPDSKNEEWYHFSDDESNLDLERREKGN